MSGRTVLGGFVSRGLASIAMVSALGLVPAARAQAAQLVPTFPHQALPVHGGTVDSLNWAGYAETPGSGVTAVDGTFTVPTASLVPPGFSATWAGIGGYNTSDLIQAGVGENSLPANPLFGPQYFAWYEILPASETPISGCSSDPSCTVRPGDSITIDIHNVSGTSWSVNLTDTGKWSFATTLTYASSESSAEWIQEAPTLVALQTLPAAVGTVHFRSTDTFTVGGAAKTIAAGNPTQINESPVGIVNLATTSPLAADGQSFNV